MAFAIGTDWSKGIWGVNQYSIPALATMNLENFDILDNKY